MMENSPKPSAEEIAKWREENADKLNVKNKFIQMPDGTVAAVTDEKQEEILKQEYQDQVKDLK